MRLRHLILTFALAAAIPAAVAAEPAREVLPPGWSPEPVAIRSPQPVGSASPDPVANALPEPVAIASPQRAGSASPQPVGSASPDPVASAPVAQGSDSAVAQPSARPAELVGRWFAGSISSIQYYDPVDGSWADPNGEGFYLILDADGSYEEGAVIQSTMYGCSSTLLGRAIGGWSIEGFQLSLVRESGETSITGNCAGSGTNTMGPQTDIYYWELGPDAYGTETLTLKMGDMSPYAAYHRWED